MNTATKKLKYFAPMHAISLPPDLIQCRSQWYRQGFTVAVYEAAKVIKEYMYSLHIFSFQIQFSPWPCILQATTYVLSGSRMWTVWLGCQGQAFPYGDEVLRSCRHNPSCVLGRMVCPLPGVFRRHQLLFLTEDLTVWLSPIECSCPSLALRCWKMHHQTC